MVRKTNPVNAAKSFNKNLRYVQGFRNAVAASSITTVQINLNAAGKFLLGIAIFPISALLTTLGDTFVTMTVNNNTILFNMGINNLNPNFVQSMIFFPTPQPLSGKDTITLSVNKQDAGATTIYTNVFYVPRM
jgi:hypothetical protein